MGKMLLKITYYHHIDVILICHNSHIESAEIHSIVRGVLQEMTAPRRDLMDTLRCERCFFALLRGEKKFARSLGRVHPIECPQGTTGSTGNDMM